MRDRSRLPPIRCAIVSQTLECGLMQKIPTCGPRLDTTCGSNIKGLNFELFFQTVRKRNFSPARCKMHASIISIYSEMISMLKPWEMFNDT